MASLRRGCTSLLGSAKVSVVPLPHYASGRLAAPRAITPSAAPVVLEVVPPVPARPIASAGARGSHGGLTLGHRVGQVASFLPGQSRRLAHSDTAVVPSFDHYRHKSNKDPVAASEDAEVARRMYSYSILGVGGAVALYGAKATVASFLSILPPSAKEYAVSQTEVKLSEIPEGKNVVFKWRKKPLFVRHRTAEEIARERAIDVGTLRDPQSDADRVARDQWLVVLGICTHLGCVPIANKGDFGGYFCPCHGSHYDASGRIRKGPAPLNLEVPSPLVFDDANDVLIVGD